MLLQLSLIVLLVFDFMVIYSAGSQEHIFRSFYFRVARLRPPLKNRAPLLGVARFGWHRHSIPGSPACDGEAKF